MRSGRPFAEVRTSSRSKSQLYEAIRQYLDEVEVSLKDGQGKLADAQEERSDLDAEIEARKSEVENLRKEKQKLEGDITRLGSELSENTAKLSSLEESAEEFRAQGFTLKIMEKLEPMITRGGDTLLKQVGTAEKCKEIEKDFACLKKKKTSLSKQVQALERKKKQAKDSLLSTRNRIDELRLEARFFKDAADTVVWLIEKGFTVEDIKSLGYGLDFLGLQGNPDLSISRLVTGLKKQKDLTILDENITSKSKECAELERAIKDAKITLATVKDVALRSINEAKSASIEAIHGTAKTSDEAFTATYEEFNSCLQASLQDFSVRAEEKIGWIKEQYRQRRETDQQKMLFERALTYGRFVQGLLESDEFLLTVSLPWILQLACRLRLWIREKLPKETVLPSASILQRQFGLTSFQPYNLAVLTDLLCQGLEAVSAKEPTHLNGAKDGVN